MRRLCKIEGQVRGLQKMIDGDVWCPDVVTQVASATRALQEVLIQDQPGKHADARLLLTAAHRCLTSRLG